MPGFTSYDTIINAITVNAQQVGWEFVKTGPTLQGAGSYGSLWYAAGTPGTGADPATTPGTSYSNTAGSMNWAATSPATKAIVTFGAAASVSCSLTLYDRLVAVSGIAITSTGSKTVNSTTLPRYATTWAGVQAWIEVTTASTTTQAVMNLASYTNDDASPANSHVGPSITMPAAATVQRYMAQLPIAVGDHGIRSVETLNVGTATTNMVVNIVLLKPLVTIPLIANIWNERDLVLQLAALPRVFDGASLALMQLGTAATATNIWGQVRIAYN